jgi:hypothetical protein
MPIRSGESDNEGLICVFFFSILYIYRSIPPFFIMLSRKLDLTQLVARYHAFQSNIEGFASWR